MANQEITVAQEQKVAPKKMTFSMAINTASYQRLINNTLKDPAKVQRFVSAITSAVAVNGQLQQCDPATILSGALLGESLGLSPSPQLGQYYLVPFDVAVKDENGRTVYERDADGKIVQEQWRDGTWHNKVLKEKKAQFQLGYKGYVQLALRSGYYKRLNVMAVKQGELKRYDPMWEEIDIELIGDEKVREKTKTIGYVAMFEYQNGFRKVLYWSREKMETHALRYSQGYKAKSGYTFWEKDFDAMAYKTMLRQLISKWGIMSIDLQSAFEQDSVIEQEAESYIGVSEDLPVLSPVTDVPMIEDDAPIVVDDSTGEIVKVEAEKAPRAGRKSVPQSDAKTMGLDDL
jgi:recombination protein RecT